MGLADAYVAPLGQFDTKLTPDEESRFQRWKASLPRQLQSTDDYDLRGAWKADARAASNGHLPDTWKKPNHPTFSEESIYAPVVGGGGQWAKAGKDRWNFWASPANLKNRTPEQLGQYFKEVEPASALILPYKYDLPRMR